MEIIDNTIDSDSDRKLDILQSAIFGLGVIAQRQPNGRFDLLAQMVPVLEKICKQEISDDLDEDDKDSALYLKDNAVSALTKLIMF